MQTKAQLEARSPDFRIACIETARSTIGTLKPKCRKSAESSWPKRQAAILRRLRHSKSLIRIRSDMSENAYDQARGFEAEFGGITAKVYDISDTNPGLPLQIQVNRGEVILYQGPGGAAFDLFAIYFAAGWDSFWPGEVS